MPECQTLSNAEDEVTWPHECKTDLRDEFMTDIDGLPRIQQILQNMQQTVAGDSHIVALFSRQLLLAHPSFLTLSFSSIWCSS